MIFYLNKHVQGRPIDSDYWCIEICQQRFELLFVRHFVKQKATFTFRIGLPRFLMNKFNLYKFNN